MSNPQMTIGTPPSSEDAPTPLPAPLGGHWSTHRWSGWPGAFCLSCGIGDPLEEALADGVDLEQPGPLPEQYRAPLCPAHKPEEFQP